MEPAAAAVASARAPNEAWRDAVSTFWNTVDTIGVALEFLPSRLRLELRSVDSRWNLAVCDSVKRLKCREKTGDATLGMLVDTFREVRSLSLEGCEVLTPQGLPHLTRLGGLTELDLSRTKINDAALDVVVRLPRVTSLVLFSCYLIKEIGVAKLCTMTQLQSLELRKCFLRSAASLERLGEALPKLTSLNVDGALTEPAAMQHLRRFPRLTSLTAYKVTDASVAPVCCLGGLTALDVSGSSDLSDSALASVCRSFPRLTSLVLRGCKSFTNSGVASVSQLSALTSLDVGECPRISEAGIAAISRLSGLKTLRVEFLQNATDAWLVHVSNLVGLTELDLNRNFCVSSIGVRSLAPLTLLRSLNLSDCRNLTDSCTATLGGFTELRTLRLRRVWKLTNAGLSSIARFPRLTELDLRELECVTNDGVAALSQLRSLEWADLRGCFRVSADAIDLLRAAIPGVEVGYDGN